MKKMFSIYMVIAFLAMFGLFAGISYLFHHFADMNFWIVFGLLVLAAVLSLIKRIIYAVKSGDTSDSGVTGLMMAIWVLFGSNKGKRYSPSKGNKN
jgi:uncharacterized membrane protein